MPAKPTRGCCSGAARTFDTNLQLLARSCGAAASVIAGVPRGGQGTGVVNFRHVGARFDRLEAKNASHTVFDPSQCTGPRILQCTTMVPTMRGWMLQV